MVGVGVQEIFKREREAIREDKDCLKRLVKIK